MENEIIYFLEKNGVKFNERDEALNMLKYSIDMGWIRFFYDSENNRIGLLTWIIENHPEGNFLLITNFFSNGNINLFRLRKFFRDRFSPIIKFQWNNNKKGKSFVGIPIGR